MVSAAPASAAGHRAPLAAREEAAWQSLLVLDCPVRGNVVRVGGVLLCVAATAANVG